MPQATSRLYDRVYWAGIIINAFFPVVEAISSVLLYVRVDKGLGSPQLLEDALSVAIVGNSLTKIVSGVILISSVYRIKRYLSNGADSKVNIKTLVIQSAAFGLFLISATAYAAIYVVYLLSEKRPLAERNLLIAACVLSVFSFVSQSLICLIFWQLDQDEEFSQTIEVEEFDKDAELQARMWN